MKAIRFAVTLFLLFILPISCGQENITGVQIIDELPRALKQSELHIIDSINSFGINLFKEINLIEEGKNIFISPLSVSMALGMTYNGAAGTTKDMINNTMNLDGLTDLEINESFKSLIELLLQLDSKVEFALANSIWHRDNFSVFDEFLNSNKDYYDAEVAALDFNDTQASETINNWVSNATNGKIDSIVPDTIDPLTMLYLINAVYFRGTWTKQFDPGKTAKGIFHLPDNTPKTLDMMNIKEDFRFYYDDDFNVAEIPYSGKAFAMTILLPSGSNSINDIIDTFSFEKYANIFNELYETEINLSLPRFKLEYELEMNSVLKALGMEIAFNPDLADFSRINDSVDRLHIQEVMHKTFVDVNEEGTEAAAATSVGVGPDSAPQNFIVDRPFLFFVRETLSNTIIFMGKIVDPIQEN